MEDDFAFKLINCYLADAHQKPPKETSPDKLAPSATNLVDTIMSYHLLSKQNSDNSNWKRMANTKLNNDQNDKMYAKPQTNQDASLAQLDDLIGECRDVLSTTGKFNSDFKERVENMYSKKAEEENTYSKKAEEKPIENNPEPPKRNTKLDQALERLQSRLKSPVINLIIFYFCFRIIYMIFFY